MREVFAPGYKPDPGRVFYTIRPEDLNKSVIQTEVGPINLAFCIGRVFPADIGKRLFRTLNNAGDQWFWSIESARQYEIRIGKETTDEQSSRG
jgi:hypothetical protein